MPDSHQNNNTPPPTTPTPGNQSNWGMWILMAVIAAILMLAFNFDGSSGAQRLKFDEFKQAFRQGLIVQNNPKDFPIEVTTSDGSSEATIVAYKYRKVPQCEEGRFFMPVANNEEMRDICNRYGIIDGGKVEDTSGIPTAGAERIWSSKDLIKLGEEGRLVMDQGKQPRLVTTADGQSYIYGSYRKNPTEKATRQDTELVVTDFNRTFQGDEVRDLLGDRAVYRVDNSSWTTLLINILPVIILILFLIFIFRMQSGGPGGARKFASSRARLVDPSKNNVTFKDVAGISEAKEEVWEIVEFLRNPRKFRNLGGVIPKGVLMVGPPGTGKPCWLAPLQEKPASPSTPSRAPTLWKCSSASAPAAYATCSPKRKNTPPASSSSMKSTPWAATEATA